MGRPALCMATLPIRGSIGVELQRSQHTMSLLVLRKLFCNGVLERSRRAVLMHGDIAALRTLSPATHVHTFTFSLELLRHVLGLITRQSGVRTFSLIHNGRPSELVSVGLLDASSSAQRAELDAGTLKKVSLSMPGGHSYSCYVFALHKRRLQTVRSKLRPESDEDGDAREGAFRSEGGVMHEAAQTLALDDADYADRIEAIDAAELMPSDRPRRRRRRAA